MRDGIRLKGRFLANEAGGKHGIEIISGRFPAQYSFVGKWKEGLPRNNRDLAEFARIGIGNDDPRISHPSPKVALLECCLRGFQQETRRRGREVSVLQLLLRGSIKGNRAQRLRASPAISSGNRNRLVERTERGRRRNFFQKFCGIFLAGTKFREPRGCRIAEIRLGETLNGFFIVGAGMRRVPAALGIAAKPVKRIYRVGGNRILHEKRGQPVVSIGLTIQIGDPGDAPFAVVGVPTVGKGVQYALVSDDSFVALKLHPMIVPRRHQAIFIPFADGIFLRQSVERGEHLRFFFRSAISLRQRVKPLGVDVQIRCVDRCNQRRRTFQLDAALSDAQQRALARGIRLILKHGEELFKLGARFLPFVRIIKGLGALLLHFHAGIRIFLSEGMHQLR